MARSVSAYLADLADSCDAIDHALAGVDLATYHEDRFIRSAVERELILIGEAVGAVRRLDPESFTHISHARTIVGLRNVLAHERDHSRVVLFVERRDHGPVRLQERPLCSEDALRGRRVDDDRGGPETASDQQLGDESAHRVADQDRGSAISPTASA